MWSFTTKEFNLPKKYYLKIIYMFLNFESILAEHFKKYSEKVIKRFNLNGNSLRILDIVCNDGTFLENFIKKKFKNVIGVEPAKNLNV